MKNIFNVSEEEKNRIRGLHLTESQKPSISSVLQEEKEDNCECGDACKGQVKSNCYKCCNSIHPGGWPPSTSLEMKEADEIDINVGEPMRDAQLPTSMGDTQSQAKVVAPCKDVKVAGCPGTSGGYRVCVTIDGNVPNQSNLNDKIIYTPCTSGGGGAMACDIGRVIEVCGPGGVGCSGLQNYQMGGTPFPQSTVPDCNYISGGGWRCHPQQGCVDVSQYSGIAQFATEQDCLNSGCQPLYDRFDCEGNGQCVTAANGQYGSLQACQAACRDGESCQCCKDNNPVSMATNVPVGTCSTHNFGAAFTNCGPVGSPISCEGRGDDKGHCINCKEGVMNTLAAIGTDGCPPGWVLVYNLSQGPCYECDGNGTCIGPSWAYGQNVFNSQSECINGTATQPACQLGVDDYDCINNQCQITAGGQYNAGPTSQDNLNACQAVCGQTWKCNLNVGCTQDPTGTYNSQTSCETACCNQSIVTWNWPPYVNGNPTCHEICAKLNTPAMIAAAAGNPLNFRHKCRYDWLIAQQASLACQPCSSSNGCCDNPGYISATMAAQYQVSSDPHCINAGGTFIGNIEDAMNGINQQNTPYGCGWLNIAQGNILSGLPAPNAGSQCNKEGRIAWLDELMTTGTAPGFTPNPATMTALYPGGTFVVC